MIYSVANKTNLSLVSPGKWYDLSEEQRNTNVTNHQMCYSENKSIKGNNTLIYETV